MSRHAEAARKLVKYRSLETSSLVAASEVFEDLLDIVQGGTGPIDKRLKSLLIKYQQLRSAGRRPAVVQVRKDLEGYDQSFRQLSVGMLPV